MACGFKPDFNFTVIARSDFGISKCLLSRDFSTRSKRRANISHSRIVFDAIFWVLDSGAKWRYIPQEFGNWNSIYHKFRQWCDSGVFEKILQSLVDNCQKYYLVEMDSTFCKGHQHATGARKLLGNQNIWNFTWRKNYQNSRSRK